METRICHICGNEVEKHSICLTCQNAVPCWKSPDLMTPEERVKELTMWYGPLEIDFGIMHDRINALVGRDVFTHELVNKKQLIDEILGKSPHPTIEMIYEKAVKIVGENRIIVADIDGSLNKHAKDN